MASESQPSSRREFLGAAAFVFAGLATASRLAAADAPKATPVKRPPNPYVYKFNIGKIEAFSISDGHMLFKRGASGTVRFDIDLVTSKTHTYVPADNLAPTFVSVTR